MTISIGLLAAVLQVGTWHGHKGAYDSIQAAVDAAHPGDWILIAPGAWKESVLVTTPGIHLRGLDRNGVVLDGTAKGFATCSADPAAQIYGRDGIQVFKTDGVTIENLTACNFLAANGEGGNQIWWNGGDGSGVIGMGSFHGAYLTASTTFPGGAYGIFVSNSQGPGVIERSYASNMSDSGFYVGACRDCNATLRFVHAQNSPQGYSGTNAGGHLVLEYSEWDHNRVGIAVTTLADDDRPSPQDGSCPDDTTKSCTFIQRNYIHDNNQPNTPGEGIAASVPTGTGVLISGGLNDTVRQNVITGNGAWGVMINDYPDPTFPVAYCDGGQPFFVAPAPYGDFFAAILQAPFVPCYFQASGSRVYQNFFASNGGFGNFGNGDIGNAAIDNPVRNCFFDNFGRITTSPFGIEGMSCSGEWHPDAQQVMGLFQQLFCDAYSACPGYPVHTTDALFPIPREPGMLNPCAGVPANPWCPTSR